MRVTLWKGQLLVAVMLLAAPAIYAPVAAKGPTAGTVTACSTYGRHGCVTAPVRRGRLGLELKSGSGVWVDCEGDCRDTLRRRTVDFGDEQLRNSDRD